MTSTAIPVSPAAVPAAAMVLGRTLRAPETTTRSVRRPRGATNAPSARCRNMGYPRALSVTTVTELGDS